VASAATTAPEYDDNDKETEDNSETDTNEADKLGNLQIKDTTGKPELLKYAIAKWDYTVILLLRHFGCIICRRAAAQVASIKGYLDEMNIGLIAIGSGAPFMAHNFAQEYNFEGDLYVDPSLQAYRALHCNRGAKLILGFKALKEVQKALGEGYRNGLPQGDQLQLGGWFLINRQCNIQWQHLEKWLGNQPDIQDLLSVCKFCSEKKV